MKIGISGYGAYVPSFRIKVESIASVWGQDAEAIKRGLGVQEKSVPDMDEDTITISVAAARNAMMRASIPAEKIGALFIGSESHPYAVKPSGTVVAEAVGIVPNILVADFEFACKGGTAGIQCCAGLVSSKEIEYGMAIGADTAQGRPGDALEYTAAAGGAAFIVGSSPLATIDCMFSYTTDTPDFWRREGCDYPVHGSRFTGKPAYFAHIKAATEGLLKKSGSEKSDFDYLIFHMPNAKFPREICKSMGFDVKKLVQSLVVEKIGNTYSGSSLLGLCNVLDVASPGDRILMTSFGSGAGSDSFSMTVTDKIESVRDNAPSTEYYLNKKAYIDYGKYVKLRKKIKL